jgi:membrane-associated phospholipid phosphatase
MLVDWFPLYLALALYAIPWALVSHTGFRAHVYPQLFVDRLILGNRGGTDILQSALWRGSVRWIDYAAWLVYTSHFFVTIVVCAILWMTSHADFLRYRRRVVSTWLTALVVYAVYPTVPPWMAAEQGYLPRLTRIIPRVIHVVATGDAVPTSSQIAAHAHVASDDRMAIYNPVAAVPSMHSALPALLALYSWNRWPKLRPLVVAYTVAMGFALVYAGEHFVFDVLAGWACAAVVHFTWCHIESRRESQLATAGSDAAVSAEEVGQGDLVETAAL